MTNKIIEAARKAQIYANPWAENDATWPVDRHDLGRFYAIARAEALEDAAKVCDQQQAEGECPERATYCADAIRALMKETP